MPSIDAAALRGFLTDMMMAATPERSKEQGQKRRGQREERDREQDEEDGSDNSSQEQAPPKRRSASTGRRVPGDKEAQPKLQKSKKAARERALAVEDDEEEDDSEQEAPVRPQGKRKKVTPAHQPPLTQAERMEAMLNGGGAGAGKGGSAVLSPADVDAQYQHYFRAVGGFKSNPREAEARRIYFMMWFVAQYQEMLNAVDPEAGTDLARATMAMGNALVSGLWDYDHDAGTDSVAKVQRLEASIFKAAREQGHVMENKARMVIPVPGAFSQAAGRGERGSGGARAPYGRGRNNDQEDDGDDKAKKKAAGTSPESKPVSADAMAQAMLRAMMGAGAAAAPAAATVFPWMQPPFAPAVGYAQQQMGAAAGMPTTNNQYRSNDRDRGDSRGQGCFVCGEMGHMARGCPKAMINQRKDTKNEVRKHQKRTEDEHNMLRRHNMPVNMPTEAQRSFAHESARDVDVTCADVRRETEERSRRKEEPNQETKEQSPQHSMTVTPGANAQPCVCGWCGECIFNIDLLQKEQRRSLGVAKQPLAALIEEQTSLYPHVFAEDSQSNSTSIQRDELVIKAEQWYRMYAAEIDNAWKLRGHEDEMQEHQGAGASTDGRAPPRAQESLRNSIGPTKKVFDKHAKERAMCGFCKRKGHSWESCMVRNREERPPPETQTPRQKEKMDFVLGLCARAKMRHAEMDRKPGESRMDAVNRAMQRGDEANEGNPWADSTKRRDKLRKQLGYWWAIGADATVLSWIGFGVKLQFEVQPQRLSFPNHKSYWEHVEHVDKEHKLHLEDGSFVEVPPEEVQIGNPLQVEVNAKGKARMCSDDRYANAHVADYEFTQETLDRHVAHIVLKDMQMITTDVEKAYYQVPLHKESQKYLAWKHRDKWIRPTILVFGLCVAPFIFTKIMRVVLTFMRMLDVRGTNCIDDNLWGAMRPEIKEVVVMVRLVFGKIGWTFNEKCVFEPSTVALYNGMWIDSKKFEIRAADEKIEAARRMAWTIWFTARDGGQVKIVDLQRLTGRLQSLKLALEGVAVWTRGIYADIALAHEAYGPFIPAAAVMYLREPALRDINFWSLRLGKQNGLPINDIGSEVHLTIHSDAGDLGYGAHTDDMEVDGELPDECWAKARRRGRSRGS
jgi:hypothetical protein